MSDIKDIYNLLCLKHLYQKRLCGEIYTNTYNGINKAKNILSHTNLESMISNCTLCKRSGDARVGKYGASSQIVFITLLPVVDKNGNMLSSKSSIMVQNIAKNVFGLNDTSYSVLSLIKCLNDGIQTNIDTQQKLTCLEFLNAQIQKIDAKLYIIFGEENAKYILNQNFTSKPKDILWHNSKSFLVTYQISSVIKNPSLKKEMYDDLLLGKAFIDKGIK